MRILVVGAGAVGSYLTAILSGSNDVTVLARPHQVSDMSSGGVFLDGLFETHVIPKSVNSTIGLDRFELVILAVKSYSTDDALSDISSCVDRSTVLLSLQNGLDNEQRMEKRFPANPIVGGTTSIGVIYHSANQVELTGTGRTVVGGYNDAGKEAAARVAEALSSGGLPTEVTRGIREEIWAKGIINSAINPLTAITGLRNGSLLEVPELHEMMRAVAEESASVARATGITLPDDDPVARVEEVASMTAGNRSSMLQDILNGRRTEVDAINGALARTGEAVGVPVPLNSALRTLVLGIEMSRTLP